MGGALFGIYAASDVWFIINQPSVREDYHMKESQAMGSVMHFICCCSHIL